MAKEGQKKEMNKNFTDGRTDKLTCFLTAGVVLHRCPFNCKCNFCIFVVLLKIRTLNAFIWMRNIVCSLMLNVVDHVCDSAVCFCQSLFSGDTKTIKVRLWTLMMNKY